MLTYLLPRTLARVNSKINGPMAIVKFRGHNAIHIPGGGQESGPIEDNIWKKTLSEITPEEITDRKILILGLGGGSLIKALKKRFPGQKMAITAVEIDPVMISLGKKYFDLDQTSELEIINADAKKFVSRAISQKLFYDYIFLDTWAGYRFPANLANRRFFSDCSKILSSTGKLIINIWSTNRNQPQEFRFYKFLFPGWQVTLEIVVDSFNKVLFCEPLGADFTSLSLAGEYHQSAGFAAYLTRLGWKSLSLDGFNLFIRKIPLTPWSVAKIQRPLTINIPKIEKVCQKENVLLLKVEMPFQCQFEDKMRIAGYEKDSWPLLETSSRIIYISRPVNKLLASFSPSTRVNLKKAQQKDLTVEIVSVKDRNFLMKLEEFCMVWDQFTRSKKSAPGQPGTAKKFAQCFSDNLFLVFVRKKTQPIWGVMAFTHDSVGYYHHVFTSRTSDDDRGAYLGIWRLITFLRTKKITYLNFESVSDPRFPKRNLTWQGFSEFKRRWGGRAIYYPGSYTKFFNPVLKLLFKIFSS